MIMITVSCIKNVHLRRVALVASLPLILLFSLTQAAFLTLALCVVEPFRRLHQVAHVMAALAPSFKNQWRRK